MKILSVVGGGLLCVVLAWIALRDPTEATRLPRAIGSSGASGVDVTAHAKRVAPSPRPTRSARDTSLIGFDLVQAQALPDGPVSDLVAEALPAAQSGDARAMRYLYLALQRCRTWPAILEAEPMNIDPAYLARIGMSEAPAREAMAAARREARLQQAEDCRGITPAQIETGGGWLRRAAEAGDPYARLAYVDALDEIVGDSRQMLAHPEAVVQFRRDAMAYLQDLAWRGMPEAMLRLSNAYASGVLTEQDFALAYGYGKAAEQMIGDPQVVPLEAYRQSLSNEQLTRAQALARSLVTAWR